MCWFGDWFPTVSSRSLVTRQLFWPPDSQYGSGHRVSVCSFVGDGLVLVRDFKSFEVPCIVGLGGQRPPISDGLGMAPKQLSGVGRRKRKRQDEAMTKSQAYYDDFYYSAVLDEDEIFPVSDEKYAEELQFQEALIVSCSKTLTTESSSSMDHKKNEKPLLVEETKTNQQQQPDGYCAICMDTKTSSEMFRNINVCHHTFCLDCIREHVATRIKENLALVQCPDPRCKGEIGPQVCQSFLPKQVFDRWENVLCESLIMGSEKFYCPFKDCSAMLLNDGDVTVTSAECPHCNRLFCAQCKVTWHAGMDCSEYKSLKTWERDPSDLMLMNLAKNKKWKRCPRCAYYVEKIYGCDQIRCRCGCYFNYR
ncbi:E3 ubiquitin-protein ligase RSL1-like [Rutidosis leptorrhynchoides]|uniref:E3 ubiquitin-protein ligase RSL1-like n=1 Tax=Rutidosis leptorrhynchoides TaxID=125765 RepID=UPI003A9947F4